MIQGGRYKNHASIVVLYSILIILFVSVEGRAANMERLFMPGKVIQGHARYEDKCKLCHKPFSKASQRSLCLDCHEEIARDMEREKGFHGISKDVKKTVCKRCHTEHKGRKADIVRLNKDIFDHNSTDFLLKGSHLKVSCIDCHGSDTKYRDASSRCIDCHKEDPHKGDLGKACNDCHSEETWKSFIYNHDKTKFSLYGRHKKVFCKACHARGRYKKTPTDCYTCHVLDDSHYGNYGRECVKCHKPDGWENITFDHDETKFSLYGKHKKADCSACHTGKVFKEKVDTTCLGCHKNDDEHKGRYGKKCDTCHDPDDWKDAVFDHDKTEFSLRDKHKKVKCDRCHIGPIKETNKKRDCYSCHKKDDVHKGSLGRLCKDCHMSVGWSDISFDHDRDTKFILAGEHKRLKCKACHIDKVDTGEKKRKKKTCYGCHRKDDIHKGQEGKRCERCHNEYGWVEKLFFDHDLTRFPLIGLHAITPCEECHMQETYKDTGIDCISCHKAKDEHKQRLGKECDLCHNPNGWKLWRFNHDLQTEFILDGGHRDLKCRYCHRKPVKNKIRLSTGCSNCHLIDDVHRGSFGLKCERCHSTRSFREIKLPF